MSLRAKDFAALCWATGMTRLETMAALNRSESFRNRTLKERTEFLEDAFKTLDEGIANYRYTKSLTLKDFKRNIWNPTLP